MTALDRAGAGPWDEEPDSKAWTDEATGPALSHRAPPLGHLCGYVGVPEGHPWFGLDNDAVEPHPDVHGGLTYSDRKPGSADWWIGFDCAHLGDIVPTMRVSVREGDTYRDIEFVTAECTSLARQAAEAAE